MLKIPEKYLKPLDYLFILRPTLFFPVWIITLAGYSTHFAAKDVVIWWNTEISWKIFFNFCILTLAAGATFIFNQLQDIESDKDNQKLFLISEEHIHPATAKKIGLILMIVSMIIFLAQSFLLFLVLALFLFVWGYLYNYPPFAWKDKAVMGIVTNLLGGMLLFLIGWIMAGNFSADVFIRMIPYILAWGAVALLTTIPDQAGDAKHDKKTFAVKYGSRVTIWLSTGWVILAFLIGMVNSDPIITHPTLLALPLFIITSFTLKPEWVIRTIRFPLLFIGLILCVQFPYFFVVILINYYLAKIYYVNRFNLDYPTFKVEE